MGIDDDVARAAAGDPGAFEVVVRTHERSIRAFAARWCPDAHAADEVAQKTFVWAYEHLRDYQPGTHFASWLKAIARNLVLAELEVAHREARNRRRYLSHLEATRLKEQSTPADDTEARTAALLECLDSLPPESRHLVNDRYRSRLPIEAIARARGSSGGAVKMLLLRARQALRRCVEGRLAPPAPLPRMARHES